MLYELSPSHDMEYDGTNRYQVVDQDNDTAPDSTTGIRFPRRISITNLDINVENINQSLASVNTFATKRNDKLQPIMLYEITSFGESTYKSMTLRELLRYINECADIIDDDYLNSLLLNQSNEEDSYSINQLLPPPPHESPPSSSATSPTVASSNPSSATTPFQYRTDMHLEKVRRTNHRRVGTLSGRTGQSIAGPQQTTSSNSNTALTNNNVPFNPNPSTKRRSSIIRIPTSSNIYAAASTASVNYGGFPPSTQSLIVPNQQLQQTDGANGTNNSDYNIVKSLRLRDLRRLDASASVLNETAVVVRRHAAIFAMDPIRAVVMADKLLLVIPDGADSLIAILDQYMKEWVDDQQRRNQRLSTTAALQKTRLQSSPGIDFDEGLHNRRRKQRRMNIDNHDFLPNIPFELHAYEALLLTVKEVESQQVQLLTKRIEALLLYYRHGTLIPMKVQSELRLIKNDLSVILNRLEGCGQALQYVLEDDEEMALMNLSLLKSKPVLYNFPLEKEIMSKHDDVEELIESYMIDLNSISMRILNLKNQIQNAEELVKVRLDTAENQLLFADTALLIVNCCIGFGNYIAGAFGMNLDQTIYLQPKHGSFAIVCGGSFACMIFLYIVIFGYFRWTKLLPANYSIAHAAFQRFFQAVANGARKYDLVNNTDSDRESRIHPSTNH